jgi:hypothetical protein
MKIEIRKVFNLVLILNTMLRVIMKKFAVLFISLLVIVGCESTQPTKPIKKADILILSPQGVDPSKDTVGFNALSRRVTQSFAEGISSALQTKNISYANVIDQNPKFDKGQKLAFYSIQSLSRAAIVLSIDTVTVGSDNRLILRAEFINQEFTMRGDKIDGVKPSSALEKTYLLKSSITGDSPLTIEDLVADYLKFLQSKNRI